MYGFFDWENFYNDRHDKPGSEQRYTFKIPTVFTWVTPDLISTCSAYGAYGSAKIVEFPLTICSFTGSATISPAAVGGFKPFFAKRYTDQTYYTGDNGYVAGWVAGYSFMLGGEKFTLTNWNEYEFDRDATYAAGNGGKEGLNGARRTLVECNFTHHHRDSVSLCG